MATTNETLNALLARTRETLRMSCYYFGAAYYPGREADILRSDAEFEAALIEYRSACWAAGVTPEWFQRVTA